MDASNEVSQISHVIQASVAPVFLLTGVGAMLSVLSNRLGRAIDRARHYETRYTTSHEKEQSSMRFELDLQARRCRMIYSAMALLVLCAILICSVIVALFASAFFPMNGLALSVASLFVAAMLAFIAALVLFLREVHLATSNLRIGPPL